jgi:hypothetical protein
MILMASYASAMLLKLDPPKLKLTLDALCPDGKSSLEALEGIPKAKSEFRVLGCGSKVLLFVVSSISKVEENAIASFFKDVVVQMYRPDHERFSTTT